MATQIPAGPWIEEKLGKELYETLALEYGACKPEPGFRPALDLTTAFKAQEEAKGKATPKAKE